MPDVLLPSTAGAPVNLSMLKGRAVVFCYPFTGRPGHPDPQGWDDIPGAHGSTPQALAFSKLYGEFRNLGAKILGLSFLSTEWQQDFAARNQLPFPLLSDEQRDFANSLGLTAFKAGEQDYLTRRTFIIKDGVIILDVFPVSNPEENAPDVLRLLKP
jgi:peroxiredoxin